MAEPEIKKPAWAIKKEVPEAAPRLKMPEFVKKRMDWRTFRKINKGLEAHPSVDKTLGYMQKQELPLTGHTGKDRLVAAAAIAAFVVYHAYKRYKASLEEGKPSKLATADRIRYLESGISQCNLSMNPADCRRKIRAQITKLKGMVKSESNQGDANANIKR